MFILRQFHWCKMWETGEYQEYKPRSGISPQHWIELRKLFQKILLQKRDNLPENYPEDSNHGHQMPNMSEQRYLSKNVVACPTWRTNIPKLTEEHGENWLKLCEDRSHWTKEDWSRIIFSGESRESPYEVYPSEILRIISSGLQRKEIQQQKISNNSPIPVIDLK